MKFGTWFVALQCFLKLFNIYLPLFTPFLFSLFSLFSWPESWLNMFEKSLDTFAIQWNTMVALEFMKHACILIYYYHSLRYTRPHIFKIVYLAIQTLNWYGKNGETRNDSIGIFITKSSKFATFWNGNALNVQHDLTNSWVDTKLFVCLGIVLFCFSDGTVLSY